MSLNSNNRTVPLMPTNVILQFVFKTGLWQNSFSFDRRRSTIFTMHIIVLLPWKVSSRYSYHIIDCNKLWQDKRSLKKG